MADTERPQAAPNAQHVESAPSRANWSAGTAGRAPGARRHANAGRCAAGCGGVWWRASPKGQAGMWRRAARQGWAGCSDGNARGGKRKPGGKRIA